MNTGGRNRREQLIVEHGAPCWKAHHEVNSRETDCTCVGWRGEGGWGEFEGV